MADLKVKGVVAEGGQGVLLRDANGKVTPLLVAALEAGKWQRLQASVKPGGDFGVGPWQIGLGGAGEESSWRNLFLRLH